MCSTLLWLVGWLVFCLFWNKIIGQVYFISRWRLRFSHVVYFVLCCRLDVLITCSGP